MYEMSNENQETIADIVADIRAQNQGLPEDGYALSPLVCDLLSLADRIEAAANREIAELRIGIEELLDALQSIYNEECTSYGTSEIHNKWRKALKGASND